MNQSFDALIIGGGIMGCSAAFELARRGLKVGLLEKGAIGAGPSGKSSAIIRQHYSNSLTARMALHSLGVFQQFDDEVGGPCGFTRTGFVLLVPAKDKPGLEANLALQREVGIRTEMLAPEAIRRLLPGLGATAAVAAAYEPDSGYADPYLTVTAYARAARRHGAQLFQDTPVIGLRFLGGRVAGVTTPEQQLDAPLVLNCAGAWGARVGRLGQVALPIDACRVQVLFVRRPPGHEATHPVVADFTQGLYFRPETGGLTLAGLIDPEEARAVVDPDRFSEGPDEAFILDMGERLEGSYPALAQGRVTGGYASLYAITPDWHPVIDELPAGTGFYTCSGFSGHGFKLGPAVGRLVADLITGASEPLFDAMPFRLDRFAAGEPVRGRYEYSIVG